MDLQARFDIGIVVATMVGSGLQQAVRSVFAQQFGGRMQILIGVDKWHGERALVDALIAEAPSHVAITVMDLGYSTSARHGGVYPGHDSGALKTILSFAANSRFVACLDDDNWYAPDHVATMLKAISGKAWAFSLRHFVDEDTGEIICADTWESLGPGRGLYAETEGGFVDTNCYLLDALLCSDAFPEWTVTRVDGATGGDRQVLKRIADRPWGTNDKASVFCRVRLAGMDPYVLWQFRRAGVDLARFIPADKIPGEEAWRQCAEYDRTQAR
jgi:hypothetical protein